MGNNESVKMTFPNKLDYSFLAQLFVREIAKKSGFSGAELDQIDIAIEESVSNIMVHAGGEENPTFDIICTKIHGGLQITLKEMGIPFDPDRYTKYELTKNLENPGTTGLGIYLIRKMMDELSFNNLGIQGKETVMIKYLRNASERKQDETLTEESGKNVIAEKIEYTVRGIREDEAIEVSRCAYKTHGYTFFDSHIYFPDRLVEMNRTAEMVSAVAVTKDNIFMGHCALLYQYPEDTIAELTFAFVNVEYRGQGAFNRLVDYLFNVPPRRELRGIYAFAVTNHIFTQKMNIRYQLKDCGIQLATSPSSWKFKGIDENGHQRISVALSFKYMMTPVSYDLYVPEHHKIMISKIYANLDVNHRFIKPSTDKINHRNPVTVLRSGVNELEGCAEIYVIAYGPDVLKQVRLTLKSFCIKQMSCINLFLGLKDPETYWLTTEFEKIGFFFSGILPETQIGDALNLQYLNNVEFDYDKIMLLSDISKEILAYIKDHDPNIIV